MLETHLFVQFAVLVVVCGLCAFKSLSAPTFLKVIAKIAIVAVIANMAIIAIFDYSHIKLALHLSGLMIKLTHLTS